MDELKTEILNIEVSSKKEEELEKTNQEQLVIYFESADNILNEYYLDSVLGNGVEGMVMKLATYDLDENKSPIYVACKTGRLSSSPEILNKMYLNAIFEYNMSVELYALYPMCICKPINIISITNRNKTKIYTYGIIMELGSQTYTSVIKENCILNIEWLASDQSIKYMRQVIQEFENLTAVAPMFRNADTWTNNVLVIPDEKSDKFSCIKFIDFSRGFVTYDDRDYDSRFFTDVIPGAFRGELKDRLKDYRREKYVTRKSKKITIFLDFELTISTYYLLPLLYIPLPHYYPTTQNIINAYTYKLAYVSKHYDSYLITIGKAKKVYDKDLYIAALKLMIDTWWELEELPDKPRFSQATYDALATQILTLVKLPE